MIAEWIQQLIALGGTAGMVLGILYFLVYLPSKAWVSK